MSCERLVTLRLVKNTWSQILTGSTRGSSVTSPLTTKYGQDNDRMHFHVTKQQEQAFDVQMPRITLRLPARPTHLQHGPDVHQQLIHVLVLTMAPWLKQLAGKPQHLVVLYAVYSASV